MPYRDPEKAREARRRWYQANREKVLEQTRERRYSEAERERRRAYARQKYWANREQAAEKSRAWRQANPEKVRENMRRWREQGGKPTKRRLRDEAAARLWREQGGCCYLCEKPLPLEEVNVDHDHRCCPRLTFCSRCVRGAAHASCNTLIGTAQDDPALLMVIALNLKAKLAEMDARLADSPVQLTLEDAS